MKKITVNLFFITTAFLAPIQLITILLMFMMGIDTVVKIISLKTIARNTNKEFKDVFKSKILRKGYFLKILGYLVLALPLLPLDFYFLTPFAFKAVSILGYNLGTILTPALFTNGLLIIFCLIELSSINENWFDFSGNNIFKSVYEIIKKVKKFILNTSSFVKDVKDDVQNN
jgi:hypothetical protein